MIHIIWPDISCLSIEFYTDERHRHKRALPFNLILTDNNGDITTLLKVLPRIVSWFYASDFSRTPEVSIPSPGMVFARSNCEGSEE